MCPHLHRPGLPTSRVPSEEPGWAPLHGRDGLIALGNGSHFKDEILHCIETILQTPKDSPVCYPAGFSNDLVSGGGAESCLTPLADAEN